MSGNSRHGLDSIGSALRSDRGHCLGSISFGSSLSLGGHSCGFSSSWLLTSQRTVSSVNRSHVVHNGGDSSETRGDSSRVAFVLFTGCHSDNGGGDVGLGDNWLGIRDRKCSDISGQNSINGGDDGGQGVQFGRNVT